jgi:uncharacterized protein with FMN-binding domain
LLACFPSGFAQAADEIELLSGANVQGRLLEIRRAERAITFEAIIGSRKYTRTYAYSKVHAVTWNGKRYVINERAAATGTPRPGRSGPSGSAGSGGSKSTGPGTGRRTVSEIEALVNEAGRTPPVWFDETPLNYPKSLDLSWPPKPPGGWNAQRNVGQYIWDIINPNPNRWREGVRLIHHLLAVHKDNRSVRVRAMRSLGRMYFQFFQDYARAAFWLRQAGVGPTSPESMKLAECYWRLGSKPMAMQLFDRRTLRLGMIKLLGDMGDTDDALRMADAWVQYGGEPHPALLAAGDACRLAGRSQTAVNYYEKVIATPPRPKREELTERWKQRARENLEGIRLAERADVRTVADGVYEGQSTGYAGPIHVEVTVAGGRLESVRVSRHQEKQFYSAMTDTPRQLVEQQGIQGVDAFSGATITAEAIMNATAKALANAPRR